jgi:hypothetical protein
MRKYYQGRYRLINARKYKGARGNIQYRSSWELKMMKYLDTTESVLEWNSEEIIIPYLSPLDNRFHRYFTDFYAKIKDSSGNVVKYVIEVKPRSQRKPPRKSKNSIKYIKEVKTYAVNQAKWKAAELWCKKYGYTFRVLDETDLGIK